MKYYFLLPFLLFSMVSMAVPVAVLAVPAIVVPWLAVMKQQQEEGRDRGFSEHLRFIEEQSRAYSAQAQEHYNTAERLVEEIAETVCPFHYEQAVNDLTTEEFEDQGLDISCLTIFSQADKEYLLLLSANYGKPESAQMLIESGVDMSTQNENGNTPCHMATRRGKIEVLNLLLAHGTYHCDVPNNKGDTPFDWAVKWKQLAAIALLEPQ